MQVGVIKCSILSDFRTNSWKISSENIRKTNPDWKNVLESESSPWVPHKIHPHSWVAASLGPHKFLKSLQHYTLHCPDTQLLNLRIKFIQSERIKIDWIVNYSIIAEWMNEWMNGWMDEWMNGWMDEWMNEWRMKDSNWCFASIYC